MDIDWAVKQAVSDIELEGFSVSSEFQDKAKQYLAGNITEEELYKDAE